MVNSSNPLFSIIIPTYNRSNELRRALLSVLNQTFKNFEIIVIDDGSTDDTSDMIKFNFHESVFYFKIENFGGPSKPRNIGIKLAKGDWVAFLDADDWWDENKLEICFKYINIETDFLYHKLKIKSKNNDIGNLYINSQQLNKPVLRELLLNGNIISNSSVVVRRELLIDVGLIDERKSLIAAEDYNTWLKIASITDKFQYINSSLGYYWVDGLGISSKNMSLVYFSAIKPFLSKLNYFEKNRVLSFIYYMDLRYKYLSGMEYYNYRRILNCVLYGKWSIKFKSIYMFFIIVFKRYLNMKYGY